MSFPLEDDPLLTGLVNDSGVGTDGTPIDKAWLLAFSELISEQVYDPLNPTISPVDIIQEVKEARAAYADLDERLDAIDAAISSISLPTANLTSDNLVINDDMSIWPESAANSSLPAGWSSGDTVARSTVNIGAPNAAQITCTAFSPISFSQTIDAGGAFASGSNLRGRAFAANCRIQCGTIGKVRLVVYDGVNTYTSSYNATTAAETLTITGTINAAATELSVRVESTVFEIMSCFVTCVTVALSNLALSNWMPARQTVHQESVAIDGTTLNASAELLMPILPTRLKQVLVYGKTVGAATTLAVTIEKYNQNTTAWEAVYSAPLAVVAGTVAAQGLVAAATLDDVPDGTYTRQCFGIPSGASPSGSYYQILRARVSTVDAAVVQVKVLFRYATFERSLETFQSSARN